MKNKKIIFLILVTLLFSGCTVDYNLYINDDLSINEKITATDNTDSLKTKTGGEPKVVANSLFDIYKIDGVKYNISTVSDDKNTTSIVSTSFGSIDEYEEYFKSDVIKEVNVTKNNDLITLEYKQDVPLTEYSSRTLIYDSINVNIELPFKVVEDNADVVNGNTYTWKINKDGELKDIKITFNTKQTDTSRKFNFGFFEINISYSVLLIAGLALVILVIVLAVYRKNKKNNKF